MKQRSNLWRSLYHYLNSCLHITPDASTSFSINRFHEFPISVFFFHSGHQRLKFSILLILVQIFLSGPIYGESIDYFSPKSEINHYRAGLIFSTPVVLARTFRSRANFKEFEFWQPVGKNLYIYMTSYEAPSRNTIISDSIFLPCKLPDTLNRLTDYNTSINKKNNSSPGASENNKLIEIFSTSCEEGASIINKQHKYIAIYKTKAFWHLFIISYRPALSNEASKIIKSVRTNPDFSK